MAVVLADRYIAAPATRLESYLHAAPNRMLLARNKLLCCTERRPVSITPATCATEQADRAAMKVLRCVYMVASTGHGADLDEVRDLLILCFAMSREQAEVAISETAMLGLISTRGSP